MHTNDLRQETDQATPDVRWPAEYVAPAVEPLGGVWEHTAGAAGTTSDGTLAESLPTL